MFINSNLDINSLSIVNDNKSEKVCSLCKNIDKSNEKLLCSRIVVIAIFVYQKVEKKRVKNKPKI